MEHWSDGSIGSGFPNTPSLQYSITPFFIIDPVKIIVDGHEVVTSKGKTVIQAAAEAGVAIPHYCYHPKLSIAGNCRMCMVEIEKMPKLQIACNTQVTEGMSDPDSKSQGSRGAQSGVGISADQSPGGLPDLRPGRRVPVAELLHGA